MKKRIIVMMTVGMMMLGLTGCGETSSANVTESEKTRIDVLDYVEGEDDDTEYLRLYFDINGDIKVLEFHTAKEDNEVWIEY